MFHHLYLIRITTRVEEEIDDNNRRIKRQQQMLNEKNKIETKPEDRRRTKADRKGGLKISIL
jgi:hypothetical protein